MKKRFSVAFAVLVGVVAALPSSALAADYTTYVGCSPFADAEPADACQIGDTPGAFFEADEETEYEVCVEFPNGEGECAEEQEAEENVLFVNEITTDEPGSHFVEWYVGEDLVGAWEFEMLAPPVVPPPPPAPPVVPPAPVIAAPSGPSPACQRAKNKAQRLKVKLGNANGKEAKGKIRPKLKAAKADARRRC